MRVQRVELPGSRLESWTVLGGDDLPVPVVERYLAFLSDVERSPNTVRAYAHDLKDWFSFLEARGLDWRRVRLEDVGEFVAWLRLPLQARDGSVSVLPSAGCQVSAGTVNRKLSALSAFYQHAARHGAELGELLIMWGPARGRGGWKPFLHHISKSQPAGRRVISLKAPRSLPRVMTSAEVQTVLDACGRLRDRLLFAVLYDTGMRVGEALGLRHEDIAAAEREIRVVPRQNANRARVKSGTARTVPVPAELVRLYADYLHGEYGDLDSDYVFVNLWGTPHGHPLTYAAVYDLVGRLRRRTGLEFSPHWYRHTAATRMLGSGIPVETVSALLGHASVTTTLATYGHLSSQDARRVLESVGWFTGRQVSR
jgi:integrase/recombinase XerD